MSLGTSVTALPAASLTSLSPVPRHQNDPVVPGILIADMSSNFCSKPVDVSKYGVRWGRLHPRHTTARDSSGLTR